jgi:Putative beta barrel porin-7 (BBP7)
VSGFWLPRQSGESFAAASPDGSTVIGRPYVNGQTGVNEADRVSYPTAFSGRVSVNTDTTLWGLEGNVFRCLVRSECWKIDGLVGFRYLDLEDDLDISQDSTVLGRGVTGFAGQRIIDPNQISIFDSFETKNRFYGGQLGIRSEYCHGPLSLMVGAKIALGVTDEETDISGHTTLIRRPSGVASTVPGGLLAQRSNIGNSSNNEFAYVPEVEARVGYKITHSITAFVGYNFLYWSDVARAGGQIDNTIDRRQVPSSLGFNAAANPTRPARLGGNSDDFWAQGINFGLAFRY